MLVEDEVESEAVVKFGVETSAASSPSGLLRPSADFSGSPAQAAAKTPALINFRLE